MSTNAQWFRAGNRTLSTRLVMAGAFVGALLVLTLSVTVSWPVRVNASSGGNDAAANLAAAFDAPAGTCLTWKPDGSEMRPTQSCDTPHLFEVTGDVDISADHGASAPSPTEETWREIAKQKCTAGAAEYLGGKLDPFGKYSVGALKPSDEQWRGGDRKLRCGLQRAAPSGKALVATKGSAKKQNQSDVYDPATCLALVDKNVGDPIDCTTQHAYEIVGVVDLSATFKNGFPPDEQQQTAMLDQCPKVVAEYSDNLNLADKKLTLTWDTRKQESWDAGSYLANCKVGAPLEDKSGLAPITGSIKGAGSANNTPPTGSTEESTTQTSTPGG